MLRAVSVHIINVLTRFVIEVVGVKATHAHGRSSVGVVGSSIRFVVSADSLRVDEMRVCVSACIRGGCTKHARIGGFHIVWVPITGIMEIAFVKTDIDCVLLVTMTVALQPFDPMASWVA